MTLFECYEKRKGQLLTKLRSAASVSEVSGAMCDMMDTIIYEFSNECKKDSVREQLAYMGNVAKNSFPLLECVNKSRIWENKSEKEEKTKGNSKIPSLVCFVIALIPLGILVASLMSKYPELTIKKMQNALYLIGAGYLFMLMAGLLFNYKKREKKKPELQVEIMADAEDIVRRMTAVVLIIDKNLTNFEANEIASSLGMEKEVISADTINLVSALLEGKYSENGEFALEQLNEVEHYLHTLGIKLYDYKEGRDGWFEFLPSAEGNKTICPAMVYEGKLLKKGLATHK